MTVKQTDIIFVPDKGLNDAIVAFDVSRKQANLPAFAPTQAASSGQKSGTASARGSSAGRGASRLDGGRAMSSERGDSNTYRGTSVAQPVSHHY